MLGNLIAELRDLMGEHKCPTGMRWNPKRKKCVPRSGYAAAAVGFRAGLRGRSRGPRGPKGPGRSMGGFAGGGRGGSAGGGGHGHP